MHQFLPTRPLVATVLLLALASNPMSTLQQGDTEAIYKYLGPGYAFEYIESSTDEFYPSRSLQECALMSLDRDLEFFSFNKANHICKIFSHSKPVTASRIEGSNEMCFYRDSEWIKVYAISMGAGSKISDSFLKIGSPSQWNVDKCNGTFCPNFFRHPILDIWNHLAIEEVKLVAYQNQTAVVTIVFDGRHSSIRSWFSKENLKSSPWNYSNQNIAIFKFQGYFDWRLFYIGNYYSCPGDNGWLVVIQKEGACPWEKMQRYPAILFSNKDSFTTWHLGYEEGDSLAIFINLKRN